jgi:hypothetical protein
MKQKVAALVLGILVSSPSVSAGQQTPRTYTGRPVAAVLRELQEAGFPIIFSSDLVPSPLLVKANPASTRPEQIAREILAPHGLTLISGPRRRWLVVPASPAARRAAPPPSQPEAPREQSPPPPPQPVDEVRIEERVEVVDRLAGDAGPPTAYAIEPDDILETAGALEDVLRALQVLPGAAATNDRDGKLAVRGAGPEHNVIVVDGVQIHNPHRLGEFTSSFLNPSTTASVALDASGLDARHGGRLSSVTVIETRDGRRDRRLAMSGSLGLTSGDILLEGRLPNTTTGSWWASARGTYYRPFMDRFGDAVPGFGDAQFKLTVRPTPHTRVSVFGLVGRETAREYPTVSDVGLSSGGVTLDGGAPQVRVDPNQPPEFGTQYKGLNRLGVTTLQWTPRPTLAATTTLSAYAHKAQDHDGSLLIAGIPAFDRTVSVTDLAARQSILYVPRKDHLLDAGVELHRIGSSWSMVNVKQLDLFRGLGPTTAGELLDYSSGPLKTDLTRTQAGSWIQYRLPLGAGWAIQPGMRFEWNSYTREASWQPRLRVAKSFSRTTAWAGVAVQSQTPSHEALQSFDYFHLMPSDGARLRNERSRQTVAGIEQILPGGFALRVETYRRRFDRLLVQTLESDAERAARLAFYVIPSDLPAESAVLEHRPTLHAESTGRGSAAGVEMLLKREGRRIGGSLAYTFSRATREMYGQTFAFDFDRPHALNALVGAQLTRHVRVAATWQGASGFPATAVREEVRFTRTIARDGTIDPFYRTSRRADGRLAMSPNPALRRLSLRNTERLSGYARADVRGTYAIGSWEFYAEMLNVFNRWNHVQRIQYSSLGTGLGELISENNAYAQFQRLPSFGIRVKF